MKSPETTTTPSDGESQTLHIAELMSQLEHHSGMQRQRARHALIALGAPAANMLRAALSSPKVVLRWEAAKAFTEMKDPESAEALVATLVDQDEDVRWLAAEALVELGQPALKPLLAELIKNTRSVWLREGAHHILRELSDEELAPIVTPVLDALDHHEPELVVPYSAEQALNKLR